jgi:acetyl-CoA carboxylase biotin carboxyl carrier protein
MALAFSPSLRTREPRSQGQECMKLDRIKSLIDAMAASDLSEMQVSEDGWSLKLLRKPAQSDVNQAPVKHAAATGAGSKPARVRPDPASTKEASDVAAPLFGIVYLQPAPNAPAFVAVGQSVTAGTPLCVIEAMKMFHEVRAERDGTIAAVLVSSGQEVEAGQQLMRFA